MYRDLVELRQLQYLVAVANEGGFTNAAARLMVAQPAISQQIRKLEAELGIELLYRGGRVRPTPAGEAVLERAKVILAEVAALREEADLTSHLFTGHVALGSMQSLGGFDLPRLIGYFRRTYPGVEVLLTESTTPRMLAALRRDELDLTFVSLAGGSADDRLEVQILAHEEMVVVGREDLFERDTPIGNSALDGRPFVAFAPGMNLRALVDEILAVAGVRPQIVLESNEPATVRALVAQGVGLAVLPRVLAESPGEPLKIGSFLPPANRQIGLAWRRHRRLPPAARRLRALALSGDFLTA
jgi:DNA-binding transcriptional LysR family regulator